MAENGGLVDLTLKDTAGMQLSPLGDCFLYALIDQFDRSGRNQRADDRLVILGIAGRQRLCARGKFVQEFLCNLTLYDDAAGVEADLSLVEEGAERRRADRIVHIHVVEN